MLIFNQHKHEPPVIEDPVEICFENEGGFQSIFVDFKTRIFLKLESPKWSGPRGPEFGPLHFKGPRGPRENFSLFVSPKAPRGPSSNFPLFVSLRGISYVWI